MILLINQHTVPIFVDVANAFASSGEKVILFTGHIELGKKPLDPSIKVVRSKFYQRRSSFTRIVSWLIFSAHYFLYLIFSKRPSKVLVVTNPPLAPVITFWVTRFKKIPYFILVYDLYPEALFQAGFTKSSNMIYRRWQKINNKIFIAAEKIFTLSESMKKAVAVYIPASEKKIKVIFNWVDSSYIEPMARESNPFVKEFNLNGKFVILYSGNMGLTHDLESVLDAATSLHDNPSVIFVFIGEGGKRQKLIDMKRDRNLANVLFLPYQTADFFPFAMASADIGIVTLGHGAEGISVPSKTYVTMAAGLCLLTIAPLDSELTRLVEDYKVGLSIGPGHGNQLAEQIIFLMKNPDVLETYKAAARKTSLLFSPENALLYVKELSN